MNYCGIKKTDIANGLGVRVSLFVSGCRNHCPGCFQPETWDFDFGEPFTRDTEKEIMKSLRTNAPKEIGGLPVIGTADYLAGTVSDAKTGETKPTNLPKSDVVSFYLPEHASVIVRPSGTEPKIKAYYTTACKTMAEAEALEAKLKTDARKMLLGE